MMSRNFTRRTHRKNFNFLPSVTSLSKHLEVILASGRRRFPNCGVLFAIRSFVLPSLEFVFSFCFLDNCVQVSGHIESGRVHFWIFVGLPLFHLYSCRSRVRKIALFQSIRQRDWRFLFGLYVIDDMLGDGVNIAFNVFFLDAVRRCLR